MFDVIFTTQNIFGVFLINYVAFENNGRGLPSTIKKRRNFKVYIFFT